MGTEAIPKTEEAVPAESPSALEQKIIRQIEYYFGDYNLSRDKFLKEQLKLDDGWVTLETLVKFNRLKQLSEDFNVIVDALKKSPKQLLEVSEDCTKIRRRTEAPVSVDYTKRNEQNEKRTLYVKGFKKTDTLDELLDFFRDHNVDHVFMRRHNHQNSRPFKGSCFVTFETVEDAQKFLETKGIKYGPFELLKEWKVDYTKRKDEVFSRIRAEKEKKTLERAGMLKEERQNGDKVSEIKIVPDCLVKLEGLVETSLREHIHAVFESHEGLEYVDYSKGKPVAVLRFSSGETRNSVLEKVKGDSDKLKIGSVEATVSLIEGEEEKEYWNTIAAGRAQKKFEKRGNRNFGNKRKWGGQKQRGGYHQKAKKYDNDDDSAKPQEESASKETDSAEPPVKKLKQDDSQDDTKESAASPSKNQKLEESKGNEESSTKKKKDSEAIDKVSPSRKRKIDDSTGSDESAKHSPKKVKQDKSHSSEKESAPMEMSSDCSKKDTISET